jgi:20S proteasome subunit beta 3
MSYNGGAVLAMKGRNCVAIAADKRFGIQAQTLALDFQVRLCDVMSQG